ncbi:uncharacterized protein LOC100909025 [Galendromus occidentalis]|uniref:Uncharacterized protein LOC100909025 n=1 Tax=Galendromus occidentalis TaxID=34638 RepID=A0AAJ6QVR9_9ACAR|nr:uncharacterized protein LOC100909025 [Galendromus occidentalis]
MAHRISDIEFRTQIQGITRNFNEMSNDELKTLVECDDAIIDTQFTDCSAARAMERTRKSLIENNRLIAQENIEKETRFFDLRNTLLKMYQEAKDLKHSIEEMQDRNPRLKSATADLDSIQAVLEAAARDAEDVSEKIATEFLDARISADDFLATFVDKRRESQLRRVNAEKVVDLLRERRRTPAVQPMPLYPGQGMMPPLGPPMTYQPPSMPQMGYGVPPYLPYPAYPPAGPMSMPTPGT